MKNEKSSTNKKNYQNANRKSYQNGKRRNQRNNTRGSKQSSQDICSNDDYSNASNSVDDFALDKQLLKDVASIPFSWAVGTPLDGVISC